MRSISLFARLVFIVNNGIVYLKSIAQGINAT